MKVRQAIGFSYITVKENIRRWGFYGTIIAFTVSLAFSRVLAEFSLQDLTKTMVDTSYSFLSLFMVVFTLFISIDVLSKDLDKKIIYVILSKGISREAYVYSRALSLLVVLFILSFALGSIFILFLEVSNYSIPPAYRKDIDVLFAIVSVLILWIKMFSLSCVVVFLSSLITNFLLVFLSAVVLYVAGSSVENLYYFVYQQGDKISPTVKFLITIVFYISPNFSSIGPDLILGLDNVNWLRISLDVMKTISFSLMLVIIAALFFRRRELT